MHISYKLIFTLKAVKQSTEIPYSGRVAITFPSNLGLSSLEFPKSPLFCQEKPSLIVISRNTSLKRCPKEGLKGPSSQSLRTTTTISSHADERALKAA